MQNNESVPMSPDPRMHGGVEANMDMAQSLPLVRKKGLVNLDQFLGSEANTSVLKQISDLKRLRGRNPAIQFI